MIDKRIDHVFAFMFGNGWLKMGSHSKCVHSFKRIDELTLICPVLARIEGSSKVGYVCLLMNMNYILKTFFPRI
jgi:hypothetical protein